MSTNATELDPFIKLFNQFNELAWNTSDVPFERLYNQATSMLEEDRTGLQMSSAISKLAVWRQRENIFWKITSVILHTSIFLLGLVTNGILIYVAWRAKFLRIPAYCYLVSLAGADLLVLCTALPMEIISYFQDRLSFNQAGCAAFAVLSFAGINVGSLSVLTFTVEVQVAVCHPVLTYHIYRKAHTKTVIRYSWIAVLVYCTAWLSCTNIATFFTQSSDNLRPSSECSLLMPQNAYLSFFITDFLLFYCVPLMVAVGVYIRLFMATKGIQSQNPMPVPVVRLDRKRRVRLATGNVRREIWIKIGKPEITRRSSEKELRRTSMLRLLFAIVLICGVAWLPFRLIPAYKTFWTGSFLDTWFLYFSSTLIYMKCAVNPLLYILLSSRFRAAVRRYCGHGQKN